VVFVFVIGEFGMVIGRQAPTRRLAYAVALLVAFISVWGSPLPALAQLPGSLVVTITSPTSGATVAGTITVSASVSVVGSLVVAGVQFELDGANLGGEDTAAPYSVSWNTTTTGNGSHTLTAVARDTLGLRFTSNPVTVTVSNDKTAPTVSISAPTSGSTVTGTRTVNASASDNVGVIGVQFQLDGVSLGAEDTAAPYSISWDTATASNGSHTLTAVARDAAGNRTTSGPDTVTVFNDTTAPTVTISSPVAGATVAGTITVSASASDNVGVVGVQFQLDGASLGTEDTAAPYSIAWDTTSVANGSHTLTARARDAAGNLATSTAVVVTVSNDTTPPTVAITSPSDGMTVSGAITVTASATDAGGVTLVQFLVDGVELGRDTAAPYEAAFDTRAVPNGTHTLQARAQDTAGNIGSSAVVSVTVANGALPPPGTEARFEETHPSVAFTSGWILSSSPRWSGGTAAFSGAASAQATFTFTGTSVSWVGLRGPMAGIARVVLDGVPVGNVDTFAPTEEFRVVIFTARGLTDASHTLTIEVTGLKSPTSTDTLIVVDAFDAPAPTVTRVQETDPSITYTAGWTQGNTSGMWSGRTAAVSAAAGAQATFLFTGTAVTWIGYRGPTAGIARVFLDGAVVAEVDAFLTTDEPQAVVFTATGLADASHTLTIEVTGLKNPASTDTVIAVDAFEVTSSSSPPPTTTRFEETDPSVGYNAGWMVDSSPRWSAGSAAFSAAAGAQATAAFSGTSISWIGFRGPMAGIARVFVDGVVVAEVDTFSTTDEAQVVLFTATGLVDASHTLTIEVTGLKNSASTGTFVVVDAFDVTF